MVTIKGSDTQWPEGAVLAVYGWLEDMLVNDVTGFLVVLDLAVNGEHTSEILTAEYIRKGVLEPDGSLQTTRRDLARLMILDPHDSRSMRLARWDELEVTPVD